MPQAREFNLEFIGTDGWFERIGEGVPRFASRRERRIQSTLLPVTRGRTCRRTLAR
jgi:hypothetical protein